MTSHWSRRIAALPRPGPGNHYLKGHIAILRRSLRQLTGRDLLDGETTDAAAAKLLFQAPLVLLSHNRAPDPILTYGNLSALSLFEMSWEELTSMPSRLTAEAPNREERARLLDQVAAKGYIDDYSGVRISSKGRRFRIQRATVWNLTDENGNPYGQAATFSEWNPLRGIESRRRDDQPKPTRPRC